MIKKFLEYIRITPKALVVVVILLIAVGIVRLYWANLYRTPGRVRLVNQELATLQTMRNEIRTAEGYRILFLGNSAAYGSAVRNGGQTVPAYLEQELNRRFPDKQVKVFNFAFKGYGTSENYFLLNSLKDSGLDMVIYNVSINWFNRDKALEHPNVVRLSDSYFWEPFVVRTGVLPPRTDKEKINDKVNEIMGRVWSLLLILYWVNLLGLCCQICSWLLSIPGSWLDFTGRKPTYLVPGIGKIGLLNWVKLAI